MRGETVLSEVSGSLYRISIHSPHARRDDLNLYALDFALKFQSTLLMRGETEPIALFNVVTIFQSTLLMRGETETSAPRVLLAYFNPLSSCEERHNSTVNNYNLVQFQSTLLMRGETEALTVNPISLLFQSTLLMRGETVPSEVLGPLYRISIHSPHARRDLFDGFLLVFVILFQSTLLMRGETDNIINPDNVERFQSTLLMRGETAWKNVHSRCNYFNPLSSCEERQLMKNLL